MLLQPGDLLADGGLAAMDARLGLGEAAAIRNRYQGAQEIEVHKTANLKIE
jgi:hypothetical protein